jgi:hypothetical protein
MTTHRFNNTATPKEKAETLRNDLAVLRKARALLDLHAIAKPVRSASDPTAVWPRLPAGPWSAQPQPGLEPPLGRDINTLLKEPRR